MGGLEWLEWSRSSTRSDTDDMLNFPILQSRPDRWQLYNVHSLHSVISHPNFIPTRDTQFYHYGFSQTVTSDNVREVIDASVAHGGFNFFLIDYRLPTLNNANNALDIGSNLADAYVRLCDAGIHPNRLHLVGFSLGAQIQAIASRNVQARTNRRIVVGRLTGLDPGQVHQVPQLGRLSSNDAAFVDTIHTESIGFGEHESIGHVGYFVNGGNTQPFCSGLLAMVCSHNFAPTAWAESVRARRPVFPALPCSSWLLFTAGGCNNAVVGNMGMYTSRISRGRHFLRTNLSAPFSRTQAGP